MDLLLTGRLVTADSLPAIGLVNCVLPAADSWYLHRDRERDRSQQPVRRAGRQDPDQLRHCGIRRRAVSTRSRSSEIACGRAEHFAEGVAAFREKRRPTMAEQIDLAVRSGRRSLAWSAGPVEPAPPPGCSTGSSTAPLGVSALLNVSFQTTIDAARLASRMRP